MSLCRVRLCLSSPPLSLISLALAVCCFAQVVPARSQVTSDACSCACVLLSFNQRHIMDHVKQMLPAASNIPAVPRHGCLQLSCVPWHTRRCACPRAAVSSDCLPLPGAWRCLRCLCVLVQHKLAVLGDQKDYEKVLVAHADKSQFCACLFGGALPEVSPMAFHFSLGCGRCSSRAGSSCGRVLLLAV